MTPLVGGTTVLLVGVMLIRLTLTDAYQRYVRVGMGRWLLVAGILLAVLGTAAVVAALRGGAAEGAGEGQGAGEGAGEQDGHGDDDGHGDQNGHGDQDGHGDHDGHGDRIGWLLLVPVLALLLVVPPALGSFGVDRSRVTAGGTGEFTALPAGSRPDTMTMLEFNQRAFDHAGSSMRGAQLRITGFVARPKDGAGFQLARYQIACCAADAVAAVARVFAAPGPAPIQDFWLTVTGTFRGVSKDGVPQFDASTVQSIPAPVDPYE